ncbi:endoglucanase [Roseateles sp. YR242]|uniref:glycoside hydrolase family 5 protein n=1 Tax=Roseateles sp. YR242 TaxID=1855305 RepID=UPI0008D25AC0|nr:glycoside hydrolase family 5 protein [Roseateles sp. YR242]SEL89195.1 endoglucanase [Roseateles sp. YR242]
MTARPLAALLMAACGLMSALNADAQTCTATTIKPYVKIGTGAWSNTAAATAAAGSALTFGPQPTSGGAWAWSGCGASASSRELSLTAKASCTAVATYTNSCGTKSTQSFVVTVPGFRDLTSLQLSALMGAGWNLGNSLEAIGGETAWGNPAANQALFTAIKAAGFKTVRIPVSWKQYADANDNISATWMARVTQVVNYARTAGLYTIINIHWDGGWMQPTYAQQATVNTRITKFWTQIANNFKGYDDTLLFAGTNEVMVTNDYGTPTVEYYTVQNSFNQTFVNAVRATGGGNLARHLVVQGFNTNIDHTVNFATVPSDSVAKRLMMEVHFYDPYNFTLNENSAIWQWGAGASSAANTETWANESYIDGQFQKMKTRFVDQGVPVILGEFGAIRRTEYSGAEAYRTAWDQYVARSAWTHGAVPIYWDAGASTSNHSMGLFDRTTGSRTYSDIITKIVNAAK